MNLKEGLVPLLKEGIIQLEEDFKNVKTDTGRTVIIDTINGYKKELDEIERV